MLRSRRKIQGLPCLLFDLGVCTAGLLYVRWTRLCRAAQCRPGVCERGPAGLPPVLGWAVVPVPVLLKPVRAYLNAVWICSGVLDAGCGRDAL